jgi:cytochrome c556
MNLLEALRYLVALQQHRLQHGFTGQQGTAHVGVQRGWQIQPGDQAAIGAAAKAVGASCKGCHDNFKD